MDSGEILHLKIHGADRGMTVSAAVSVTLIFVIALTAVVAANNRISVAANWDEMRCSPYVVPIAGLYKPTTG
jgi:formate hydrogenlyase subunit 4